MMERLSEQWIKNISIEAAMFASWLEEKHNIVLHPDKLKNIIKKLLIRNNIEHTNSELALIGVGVITMLDNENLKTLRKQRFDFQAKAFS